MYFKGSYSNSSRTKKCKTLNSRRVYWSGQYGSLIHDAEEQLHWKQIYDESKIKGRESLESILQEIVKHISCVDLL